MSRRMWDWFVDVDGPLIILAVACWVGCGLCFYLAAR